MPILGGHLQIPRTRGDLREQSNFTELIFEPGPDAIGPADFVMRATEHRARSTGDVLADARLVSPDHTRIEPGPVVRGIRVAWTYDETQWNGVVPIPLVAPVLVHPDGTVQRLTFHLTARLAAQRETYLARARAIVDDDPNQVDRPRGRGGRGRRSASADGRRARATSADGTRVAAAGRVVAAAAAPRLGLTES